MPDCAADKALTHKQPLGKGKKQLSLHFRPSGVAENSGISNGLKRRGGELKEEEGRLGVRLQKAESPLYSSSRKSDPSLKTRKLFYGKNLFKRHIVGRNIIAKAQRLNKKLYQTVES